MLTNQTPEVPLRQKSKVAIEQTSLFSSGIWHSEVDQVDINSKQKRRTHEFSQASLIRLQQDWHCRHTEYTVPKSASLRLPVWVEHGQVTTTTKWQAGKRRHHV
jgi:hypothetical protein